MPGSADETVAAGYRPLLFSIAYGMTGSVGDAEDIVQDAFLGLTRARGGDHDHRSEGVSDQATRRVILTFARSLAT